MRKHLFTGRYACNRGAALCFDSAFLTSFREDEKQSLDCCFCYGSIHFAAFHLLITPHPPPQLPFFTQFFLRRLIETKYSIRSKKIYIHIYIYKNK